MGVRSLIARSAGKLARAADPAEVAKVFSPGTPESFRQGETASGMTPASPFSPGQPIGPYDGYDRNPRQRDFVTGYNIATRPRTHERVSFEALRGLIEAYDIAQLAIWHRIDSIRSLDWKLVPADDSVGDISDAIRTGMAALEKPDREHYFDTWFAMWAWDILAYDAGCLYRMRNLAGRPVGLQVVSGPTVAPLLDYWGRSPQPPAEAYVQYINGLPWNWLTRSDLIYEPFRPRPDSPYGQAPLEAIILNANTDLRFQVYFLERFTSGNLPAAFAAAPETWSPDQIEQFQSYWDSFMFGDQSRKHQIRWLPGGSKFTWSNEKDFSDVFSLFLMRKSLAAYHVVPADVGFTENVNRSSGESQADVQHRMGDAPFAKYCSRILTGFLRDDLGLPLRHMFDLGEEQDDRVAQAQADQIYVDMGAVGPSEIREMRYGRAEPEGRPVPRFINSSRQGPIPLAALYAVAGEIDPETGAPAPGAKLPRMAFGGVEGVIPNPPLHLPSLAEQEFGRAAIPPAPPPQPVMDEPVAKDGEAAGITAATGIYSEPLIRDDDEDEPEAVAKELAAFRRFERARRQRGDWRDFQFRAVAPVTGHRLNDAGRLAVRKAAGDIAVAGLAVRAADTGRVLMLQRALCDDDPAAGKLEFPGGHLEQGESPLQAAWREFSEETGCPPPAGCKTGEWTAGNGIYQGIVWTAESEASVPVRGGAVIPNPDDPDGDQVEAIMWLDPADLPGNPMLRPELAADLDLVMAALGSGPDPEDVAKGVTGGPKGLDPAEWTGVWAETYSRRQELLARHEKAILAAWNALAADLNPDALARQFRQDAGVVAKADPDRAWWKDRGRDAAVAWLALVQQQDGWAAFLAALEAAIADGMAEGEADALAVAASRQHVEGFSVTAAFTVAVRRLQGDPGVSQEAQDAAQSILEGAAADLSVTLADAAENGASETETAAAVRATVTGSKVRSVKSWAADTIWRAAGRGFNRLVGWLRDGTPPDTAPPGRGAPPIEQAGPVFINWVCESGAPCITCKDNQGGSPYAPQDVPQYLAHPRCMCALYLASDVPSSYFNAYLLE